ncbi:hypothetical protein BJ085DRAFT_27782 [Dimargaris cristalligena]|uniref:Extracellular membrane protein CFEM domain-containing protein n=1 Tax=Dimargaris cristalligena TaxID=215637 RepID=A0A4P9ZKI1_9FUNG|nr:hypothetical protein BJ085DRAFT_27782 [Dimargaris cristalligena]|eukprot:RKP33764.1 hypothetical protein BJ085DRAFT_27782 [Dimargaris cristalligena]
MSARFYLSALLALTLLGLSHAEGSDILVPVGTEVPKQMQCFFKHACQSQDPKMCVQNCLQIPYSEFELCSNKCKFSATNVTDPDYVYRLATKLPDSSFYIGDTFDINDADDSTTPTIVARSGAEATQRYSFAVVSLAAVGSIIITTFAFI